jgi:cutinase
MFAYVVFLVCLFIPALAVPAPREDCSDIIVIFARGTLEVAPIGSLVGPPFRDAITAALPGKSLSFEGVDYPANIKGFLEGGDPDGSKTHAQDLEDAATACPHAALITSGYRFVLVSVFHELILTWMCLVHSQGGQLVHNSAKMLTPATVSRINAAVIFGDPGRIASH